MRSALTPTLAMGSWGSGLAAKMTQHCDVLSRVSGSDPALVVSEGDIEQPTAPVLDSPVGAKTRAGN